MDNPIKTFSKNLIIVLVILFLITSIFTGLNLQNKEKQSISLSQLAQDINSGSVKKINVNGEDLAIFYSDNSEKTTRKETESSLSETLKNYGVYQDSFNKVELNIEKEKESVWSWLGPFILFNLLPLLIIGFFIWSMFKQSRQGQGQVFDFSRSKAKLFDRDGKNNNTTFANVGGLKEAKEELQEVVDFLKNPKKFLDIGARVPKGILLVGATGTGKTLIAKAVASQANAPFFSISGSEFIEMFVGVGAARVRDLFANAKRHQPSIIFIDELDAIGGARGPGFGGGHEEREQTLNQILVEMDGFDKENTCIILGATNRPDMLDPALLRPGRFDRRVVFDLPDVNSREEILKIHSREKKMEEKINLQEIAERTPGFSGADLASLLNEAALLAVKRGKLKVSQQELLESIDKVLLGPERKSHLLSPKEKELSAYHEVGHALVNHFLHGDKEAVRKISIISRGMAGGYTLTLPKEEKHFKTKTEFMSDISTLLGGYCAEEITFNEITTGASNDLQISSEIARNLVKEYGMSPLGPITYGKKQKLVFLKTEYSEEQNYSEKMAERIDEEVQNIVKDAKQKALSVLGDKKSLLEKIAKILIEKETIEREEFESLVQGKEYKKPEAKKNGKRIA